ncbi:hypothetical protein ACM01_44865 [Streptomyces viridochromogenes]|uniref:Translation initiation factor 5A C-terminal domain-containing protein n=1 Tax=Streptomyces viridochromogenes TaxID=1938 RepID=A0A0J8BMK9_STRVR|nr:hypothetical protein [Streptomyces viridochromogenes]KMS66830.1 hypothetical protein ACM01_44865 [Streptomyces viridochromogenes]
MSDAASSFNTTPNVQGTEYLLVCIEDGYLNLVTEDGASKDDIRVPEGELGQRIMHDYDAGKDLLIAVGTAMGEEKALSYRLDSVER